MNRVSHAVLIAALLPASVLPYVISRANEQTPPQPSANPENKIPRTMTELMDVATQTYGYSDPKRDKAHGPIGSSSASTAMTVTFGPPGYAYNPLTGEVVVNEKRSYLSLYFALSATPVLVPKYEAGEERSKKISDVMNQKQDLKKMDVEIELIPYINKGTNGQIIYDKKPGLRNRITVLATLPNKTEATTEDSDYAKAAKVAGAAGDILLGTLSGAATGGLTTSSLGPKLTSSSTGLGVAFSNIFPPKSVPTQYAFQRTPQSFGWFFRQHTRQASTASILGMHYGLALIAVDNPAGVSQEDKIVAIGVKYQILSQWNKPVDTGSKWAETADTRIIPLPVPDEPKKVDIKELKELDSYPILIPVLKVAEILRLTSNEITEEGRNKDLRNKVLTLATTNEAITPQKPLRNVGDSITKRSLEEFLGLKSPNSPALPPQQTTFYIQR